MSDQIMEPRVSEIERWRREHVDPAIQRLREDNTEIKRTLEELKEMRRETKSARVWSIITAFGMIAALPMLAYVAVHAH